MHASIIALFSSILFSVSLMGQTINYKDLNVSKRPKGSFNSYISKNGEIYSIGDTIRINKPSGINGAFIYISKINIILSGDKVGAEATNTTTVIKKIRILGTKSSGWKVNFQTKGFTEIDNYFLNIENAIESKEIIGKGMTSDEALTALKRAKEKLDLGLITEGEYNILKEKLRKYIK